MRTGAAGVLVGFGGGAASTTRATLGIHAPMATAVADVAGARRDYLDESGGRYVHVIADGGVGTSGDIVKALAMGADAVMLGVALARATDAPGRGYHWGPEAHHSKLPRGRRVKVDQVATLEEVLYGPAPVADGTANLIGALRKSMATTGYSDLKEFQRVEVVVAPYSARMTPDVTDRDRRIERRDVDRVAGPAEVFPPTLREVMLRPRWIAHAAALPRRRGRVRLARAVAARPRDRRPTRRRPARPRRCSRSPTSPRRASTCPSRSSASASTVDRHVGARGLPRRRRPGSTTASRATGSPVSCASPTATGPPQPVSRRRRDRLGRRPTTRRDAAASAAREAVGAGRRDDPVALTGRLISDEGPRCRRGAPTRRR